MTVRLYVSSSSLLKSFTNTFKLRYAIGFFPELPSEGNAKVALNRIDVASRCSGPDAKFLFYLLILVK